MGRGLKVAIIDGIIQEGRPQNRRGRK